MHFIVIIGVVYIAAISKAYLRLIIVIFSWNRRTIQAIFQEKLQETVAWICTITLSLWIRSDLFLSSRYMQLDLLELYFLTLRFQIIDKLYNHDSDCFFRFKCKDMSFRDYLKSLKYLASKSVKLNFVLGNSSVDFDSFFGSLIYSYYLNHFSTPEETYVPLIDCPEEDIKLRFEIYKILKDTNSQPSDLLYYKSYLKSPQQIKKHKFILYDHNSRPQIPSQNIDHIVDHHFFQKLPVKRFLIHKVGSVLTLLYYIYNPHKLAEVEKNIFLIQQMETKEESLISQTMRQFLNCQKLENNWKDYDRKVDQLIRYGVLIDTFGFDPNQRDRWSIYDRYVVDQIQSEGNYKISYEQLSAYKFDQTLSLELSLSEHFRKDYKKFIYASKNIPKGKYLAQYSIISLDPDTFINKYGQGLTQQAEKYQNLAMNSYLNIQIQGCVYFLMFVYEKDGILQRQMIFKANKPEISQIIEKILEDQKMKRVQMEIEGWRRWNDPSCQVSRKKFDVLMNKHF